MHHLRYDNGNNSNSNSNSISSRMERRNSVFFVDLQGFMDGHVFVAKEMCILSVNNNNSNNNKLYHYIFKPPYDWYILLKESRQQALWLKCFHHGFNWSEGFTDYFDIYSCIQPLLDTVGHMDAVIYVKGREKVEWLRTLCQYQDINCVNIEDVGCTINLNDVEYKSQVQEPHCHKHKKLLQCAYQNVLILQNWFKKHYNCNNNSNSRVQSSQPVHFQPVLAGTSLYTGGEKSAPKSSKSGRIFSLSQ